MKQIIHLFSILIICWCSCARQSTPSGGPKDTTPPKVDSTGSTKNFVTNFYPKQIELKFDEWVVLSDVGTQVVVSPPLEKKPTVTLNGKKVLLKFDQNEKFRDSTTYTVNFGTAVKDLHEGNPAKDLRFVFSTGDFIDSLRVKGRIVDAFTGDPVENVSVMLYKNLADSVVRKERPYYFSRTDKGGTFEIGNVKEGVFKLIAMEDSDQNLRWDGENDRIGFLDSLVQVHDSIKENYTLKIFKNQPRFRVLAKEAGTFGMVRLKFSTSADSAIINIPDTLGLKTLFETTQDSVVLWYDLMTEGTWEFMVNKDTIPVKGLSRSDFIANHQLLFYDEASRAAAKVRKQATPTDDVQKIKTVQHFPGQKARLEFNYPITALDTSKWILTRDTLGPVSFTVELDSLSPRSCLLDHAWSSGSKYTLTLLPAALTDFWGENNTDTLRRMLNIPTEKQLGGLILKLPNLQEGQQYLVELMEGAKVIQERQIVAKDSDNKLIFSNLNVGAYTVRLTEDNNENGRWDTGDYWSHRPPERIVTKKLDPLRANWELESSISFASDAEIKKRKK
ncbi:MAG: Ig-like domain-containing protein [Lewinellaceae bacterium]|nr:Ig-like domain-containing protein [Lewinellaceae bacterium]